MTDNPFEATLRYYCVHVSKSGRVSLRWSEPMARPSEATAHGQRLIAAGEASLSFVVEADGAQRRVMVGCTRPPSAKRIVEHYLSVQAATETSR